MGTVPPHLQPIIAPHGRGVRRSRAGDSRFARISVRMCYRVMLVALMGVLVGLMFMGQTISAPDWVRQRVTDHLERTLEGHRIAFGDMRFVIRRGWRPRFGLSDVHITDPEGLPLLDLSQAEVSLAMRPLLQGTLSPKKITLSGVRATLRRREDGTFALEYGAGGRVREEAASLPALLESWEELLLTEQYRTLTEFELTALTLRYDDGRSGRSWTVDDGQLLLERKGDDLSLSGGFALLGGRSYASSLELSYQSSIRSSAATFAISVTDMAAEDIAVQTAALGWLAPLRAPISGALDGSIAEDGALQPVNASLRIGEGVLQPTDATRPIPFHSAHSFFSFDPVAQVLTFDELSIDSALGSGTMAGQAYLSGLESGRLRELVGQFSVGEMTLNPEGVFDAPLRLTGAEADLRLRLSPFEITLGQARIDDGASQHILNGWASAAAGGWDVALNGQIGEIGHVRLKEAWPRTIAASTRGWLVNNMSAGTLSDVDWALRKTPGTKADFYVDFEFDGATVAFAPIMPPLTGASGHASLAEHRLVVSATSGMVTPDEGGPIDVAGTSFIVPDVRSKPGTQAVVRIEGRGTPTAALSLLNRPPLSVLGASGLPVSLTEGTLDFKGLLALPMQKQVTLDDMEFHVNGRARDVRTDVLVPGHVLSAEAVDVRADNGGIEISGTGEISGIPASATWRQPLGAEAGQGSRAEGTIELSRRAAEAFRLGLPSDLVRGRGTGQFTLALPPGVSPRLTVTSDLDGVGLALPALGWRKSTGSTGALEVRSTLGARPDVERLSLSAAGLSAVGRVRTRPDGSFDRASFGRVRLSNWLDVEAELRSRGTGRAPEVRILGGRFDLAKAKLGDSGGGDSSPLSVVSLDRLQISDGIALTGLRGDFTTTGGLNGSFTGRVNGGTPVAGRVVPQGASNAVEITSSEAGGVFRDAGIIEQARGGNMTLKLVPAPDAPGQYDGSLRVTKTRVTEAPAIAALINAISLVGLFDELSGNGIVFAEVDARFRLGPRQLILTSSSAIGPSIGMSMHGIYDLTTGQLDMQGVLSPLYLLNAVGSIMTRKGEGLIGFNFNLKGAAADPRVFVNPLSALAPGILREMFRKPAPVVGKSSGGLGTTPQAERQQKQEKRRREIRSGEDR